MPGAQDITSLVSATIVLSPFGTTCREPKTSTVLSHQQPSCYRRHMPGAQDIRSLVVSATIVKSPFWQHMPGAQDITSLVISASIVLSPLGETCREPKPSPALSDQQPSCYSPLAINMTRAQDTQSCEHPSCYLSFGNQHAGSARHHQSCHISVSCAISPWQHMPGAQDITSLVRAETIVLLSLGNHCAIMSC